MFRYVFDLTQCMWCFSVRYDMTMARHVWSWTYRPNLNLISVRYPCDQDFIQKKTFFHVQWSLASECLCDLSSKKFRTWFGKWKGCLVPSPRHGRPSSRFIYQLWEGIYPQTLRGSYCTKNLAACFFCWTGSIFLVSMLNYQGWIYVGNLHVSQQLQWPFHTSLQASESRLGA